MWKSITTAKIVSELDSEKIDIEKLSENESWKKCVEQAVSWFLKDYAIFFEIFNNEEHRNSVIKSVDKLAAVEAYDAIMAELQKNIKKEFDIACASKGITKQNEKDIYYDEWLNNSLYKIDVAAVESLKKIRYENGIDSTALTMNAVNRSELSALYMMFLNMIYILHVVGDKKNDKTDIINAKSKMKEEDTDKYISFMILLWLFGMFEPCCKKGDLPQIRLDMDPMLLLNVSEYPATDYKTLKKETYDFYETWYNEDGTQMIGLSFGDEDFEIPGKVLVDYFVPIVLEDIQKNIHEFYVNGYLCIGRIFAIPVTTVSGKTMVTREEFDDYLSLDRGFRPIFNVIYVMRKNVYNYYTKTKNMKIVQKSISSVSEKKVLEQNVPRCMKREKEGDNPIFWDKMSDEARKWTIIGGAVLAVIIVVLLLWLIFRKGSNGNMNMMQQRMTQQRMMQQRQRQQGMMQQPTHNYMNGMQQQVMQQPVMQQPVMQPQPLVQQPMIQQPVIQQPIVQQPVVMQQPVIQSAPVIQQPVMTQPMMTQPMMPRYY